MRWAFDAREMDRKASQALGRSRRGRGLSGGRFRLGIRDRRPKHRARQRFLAESLGRASVREHGQRGALGALLLVPPSAWPRRWPNVETSSLDKARETCRRDSIVDRIRRRQHKRYEPEPWQGFGPAQNVRRNSQSSSVQRVAMGQTVNVHGDVLFQVPAARRQRAMPSAPGSTLRGWEIRRHPSVTSFPARTIATTMDGVPAHP